MNKTEKVILVGIQLDNGENAEESLNELAELAKTAGAETIFKVVQNRESFHPATYIGKGKIDEIRDLCKAYEATGIICDDELSPTQMKNLEDALSVKVIDRTILILDIFAQRASTAEGKIQVELAQLKYRMTRLSGFGVSLSRLGGGIGTRGPGETKLETDKRRIRTRISQLKSELKDVVRHREITRSKREKNNMPVFAIVGYTNAGKSTLLNYLTDSDVLSENKLFATLDPTTRTLILPSKEQVLLTDTVGFINKLPHHLVDAFKSTLEEAKYADLIVHVVDSSDENYDKHMKVVYKTLDELGVVDKKVITLFNKCDISADDVIHQDRRAVSVMSISAKTGENVEQFLSELESFLHDRMDYVEKVIPFENAGIISRIRSSGQLISEEYTENGIEIKAYVPKNFGRI